MFYPPRKHLLAPQALNPGTTTLLGTSVPVELETNFPLEELIVIISATVNAALTTAVTPDQFLGVLKRARLTQNIPGGNPRPIVDFSGVGLLEYASLVGFSVDRSTLAAVGMAARANFPASLKTRIAYRIPLVHPMIGEPLRSRMLLPVHTLEQAPILTLDFDSLANLVSSGSLTSISAEVMMVGRAMTPAETNAIIKKGGFIPFDLLEQTLAVPTGYSAPEWKAQLASGGSYLGLMFRQYLGGATVTRDVVDKTTTFGAESRWRLDIGGQTQSDWRWKHLQIVNDFSKTTGSVINADPELWVAAASAGSPTVSINEANPSYAGVIAANTAFQPAALTMLDFLTDGVGAEGANELGSVLDANTAPGAKVELVGEVANVATNQSVIYTGGHRVYGDLSAYQARD